MPPITVLPINYFVQHKFDTFVKSRHTRAGGYPETLQLFENTGFPIKDFGNDSLEKDFLRLHQICRHKHAELVPAAFHSLSGNNTSI